MVDDRVVPSDYVKRHLLEVGIEGLTAMGFRIRVDGIHGPEQRGADITFEFIDDKERVLVTVAKAYCGEGDTVTLFKLHQPLTFTLA